MIITTIKRKKSIKETDFSFGCILWHLIENVRDSVTLIFFIERITIVIQIWVYANLLFKIKMLTYMV